MSSIGMFTYGVSSSVGGGLLTGLLAASFSDSLPTLLLLISGGALAGSIMGWYGMKGRQWHVPLGRRNADMSVPPDNV